ncbi:M99 family carboxypeptidase catalytic domain-containing protein [Haloglomus salinum]|jgi:hypothetical protein|uniref:M99 family carboxypeptidase catalytic domain-containing protein n=1 Tax=Haloglomus salinum TaxID=2962673 RepID=UPI0020C98ECC|nr:succinylglutamate desuccinylase/aspartoacylase family protein [Haloglomus salinum]
MRDTPTTTDPTGTADASSENSGLSRRSFVKAAGIVGLGTAALSSSASPARAAPSSDYTIFENTVHEQPVHVYEAARDGPTTLVVGGIHGDEQAGYRAADQIADWTVDRGKLVVVPRANPQAIAADHRPWSNDLNRQFPPTDEECYSRLARGLWATIEWHDPDWVFDLHSSRGIYKSGDGGVGQALFPTWTDPSRSSGEQTVASLNAEFDLSGDMAYRMGNTLDADRDLLMHRVAGVLDRPGFLCESTEKASLDEQVAWHLFTVEHVMAQYGQHRGVAGRSADGPVAERRTISLDDPWDSYSLSGNYEHPVVLAPALSYAGPQPAHSRVRNVSPDGFEARVEEWLYQNDVHYPESAGMLALEAGSYTLSDGRCVEVGTTTVGHQFESVSFGSDFGTTPVVLTQSQTVDSDGDPIVTRTHDVSTAGFDVCVQEEDGEEHGGYHSPETVAYVAIEPGLGAVSNCASEAGRTTADENWTRIEFDQSYADPVFLASVESYAGWNSVSVRYRNLTGSSVEVMLGEEQSADEEQGHVDESVAYLVLEG